MSDLELLRQYEPVIRFTKGEMFFPSAVDEYVACCSLWERDDRGRVRKLVAKGELDLERLAEFDHVPLGHQFYLRYVEQPLEPLEYQRWLHRPERVPFEASSRLARVPLLSRIAGSLFDLSLLIRGVVPGGTTAAAEVQYRKLCGGARRRVYYGRVICEGGWIVLQYLFFYPMNNWRSTFYGANDHEADWEQVFVYLSQDTDGRLEPCWVAYASHDYSGDDLRRRWDDPLLVKEGTHPVIFVGAGSHASYFEPGEYIM
ncbi:MAG: NPP1 family protein, partial [Chloroflexota bacterium]|nr:NPP1 family protein [Chloroflexota bacterium]